MERVLRGSDNSSLFQEMTYVCSSEFGNFVITLIYSYTWFMKNQTIMEKFERLWH
jgi:hypothetical protein